MKRVLETGAFLWLLPPLLGVMLLLATFAPAGALLLIFGFSVWRLHWLRREP